MNYTARIDARQKTGKPAFSTAAPPVYRNNEIFLTLKSSVYNRKKLNICKIILAYNPVGGMVTPPYCSFCEGRTMGLLSDGEIALGTNNRNFLGRYGSPKAQVYLSSPAVAAASALKGEIADPRKL